MRGATSIILFAVFSVVFSCPGTVQPDRDKRDPVLDWDLDGDGWEVGEGDCNDHLAYVHPLAVEICDGLDNDCDGILSPSEADIDGDGYLACDEGPGHDCDDEDAALHPGDSDGDGVSSCEGDCDDSNPAMAPFLAEVCDGGVDNNCDGVADDVDADGDGYLSAACGGADCDDEAPELNYDDADGDGYSTCGGGDCDDTNPALNPDDLDGDGYSTCDGDCDDEDAWLNAADADADGYSTCDGDCDDGAELVSPAAADLCGDGLDNNCDGAVDGDPGFGCVACTTWVPGDHAAVEDAVDAAADGEVVCVEPGTYATELGFGGKAITVVGVGGSSMTTLDGGGLATVVKFIDGEGPDSVLQGFTLTNGHAGAGGGAKMRGASPTLRLLVVENNTADEMGGGLYLEESGATLLDVIVRENESGDEGGGLHAYRSTLEIRGGAFAENASTGGGGGLSLRESEVTLVDVAIQDNGARGPGAGLAAIDSLVWMTGGQIEANQCNGDGCLGGGAYLASTDGELVQVQVLDNACALNNQGGGIYAIDSSPRLRLLTVARNEAGGNGGGLSLIGGAPQLEISRIEGNSAGNQAEWGRGGGIYLIATDATLENLIVAGNDATFHGGGVYLHEANPTLRNVAIAGNTGYYGGGIGMKYSSPLLSSVIVAYNRDSVGHGSALYDAGDSYPTLDHCDVLAYPGGEAYEGLLDPTGANGNISTDPGFLDQPAAGGAGGDLHLEAGAVTVDAGDPSLLDPDGSPADMGAYGGPAADSWDLDRDGYPEWWLPGPYDPATSPDMDCDDRDPEQYPGSGC
jgi:hypothetical protein